MLFLEHDVTGLCHCVPMTKYLQANVISEEGVVLALLLQSKGSFSSCSLGKQHI